MLRPNRTLKFPPVRRWPVLAHHFRDRTESSTLHQPKQQRGPDNYPPGTPCGSWHADQEKGKAAYCEIVRGLGRTRSFDVENQVRVPLRRELERVGALDAPIILIPEDKVTDPSWIRGPQYLLMYGKGRHQKSKLVYMATDACIQEDIFRIKRHRPNNVGDQGPQDAATGAAAEPMDQEAEAASVGPNPRAVEPNPPGALAPPEEVVANPRAQELQENFQSAMSIGTLTISSNFHHTTNEDMLNTFVDHEELRARIMKCHSIKDFVEVYESLDFKNCLRQLEDAQVGGDRKGFAEEWAKFLVEHDPRAKSLEEHKRTLKCLLLKLCDACTDDENSLSREDIIQVFKDRRVISIMLLVVVMDRADALYHLVNLSTNVRGKHWYAKEDATIVMEIDAALDSIPPMNKRYRWLIRSFPELRLQEYRELMEWVEPCLSPLTKPSLDKIAALESKWRESEASRGFK